jgi:hypothetical protein
MKGLSPKFAVAGAITCSMLLYFPSQRAVASAAAQQQPPRRLISGPELEIANGTMAIIRWTTTNPGGTSLHYGVVHYGLDAKNLTEVAKSPNRRNPSHSDMIFRVRVGRLNPHTTYYYWVESVGATGVGDKVSSAIGSFKTQ